MQEHAALLPPLLLHSENAGKGISHEASVLVQLEPDGREALGHCARLTPHRTHTRTNQCDSLPSQAKEDVVLSNTA